MYIAPPIYKTELLMQLLFEKILILLFMAKYIPPALLAELDKNEELINYSIILLASIYITPPSY